VTELNNYRSGENIILAGLKKKMHDPRLAVDSCNRYSISVRGISPDVYGILRKANIAKSVCDPAQYRHAIECHSA
jgi:hypothetical protein